MESITYMISTSQENDPASSQALQASDFEELFEAYFKRVYNFVSYRINNHHDTEELVSQVFEKVISKYGTYNQYRSPMEAWIIGIAKNIVNDYYRKQKRRTFLPLDSILEVMTEKERPDDVAVKNEENALLMKALNKLTEKERNIVSMKFAAQLRNKDIAKIMGLSESNIGIILFRSMKKMRKELEKGVSL